MIVAANVMDLAHVLSMVRASARSLRSKARSDKFDTTLGFIFMKISIVIGATGVSIALHNAMAH
jgi:hypothetical protein